MLASLQMDGTETYCVPSGAVGIWPPGLVGVLGVAPGAGAVAGGSPSGRALPFAALALSIPYGAAHST